MKIHVMSTLWSVVRKELLDISRDHRTLLLGLLMGPLLMPLLILGMGAISENRSKTQLWQFAVPFLAQNQMIMMLVRSDAISPLEWAVYLGAGLGLGLMLWLVAARLYHQEKLAISA